MRKFGHLVALFVLMFSFSLIGKSRKIIPVFETNAFTLIDVISQAKVQTDAFTLIDAISQAKVLTDSLVPQNGIDAHQTKCESCGLTMADMNTLANALEYCDSTRKEHVLSLKSAHVCGSLCVENAHRGSAVLEDDEVFNSFDGGGSPLLL